MNTPIVAASFDSMDYGELETFEDIVGFMPTTDEELAKVSRSRLMIGLAFIAARREDPAVTLEEIKKLPLGSIILADTDDEEAGKD